MESDANLMRQDTELAQTVMLRQQEHNSNMLMWQLSPDDVLEKIEHYLKNEELNSETDSYVKKVDEKGELLPPIANARGINAIMSELNLRIHKIMNLSDFSEEQADRLLWEINEVIIDILELKQKEFGIDSAMLSAISNGVDHVCESQIYRAVNEGERRRLYPSQQTIQHLHSGNPEDSERKKFNLFNAFGGGR